MDQATDFGVTFKPLTRAIQELLSKLPTAKTPIAAEQRRALFRSLDPNGNGHLSLAEVDKGLKDVCGEALFKHAKPVIIRAFNAAKNAGGAQRGVNADYIQPHEFRVLCCYLCKYFELWTLFQEIDASNDRRLSLEEFKMALGKIKHWRYQAEQARAHKNAALMDETLKKISDLQTLVNQQQDSAIDEQERDKQVHQLSELGSQLKELTAEAKSLEEEVRAGPDESLLDAEATFRQIDTDGHGMVLFDEFVSWATSRRLDNDLDPIPTPALSVTVPEGEKTIQLPTPSIATRPKAVEKSERKSLKKTLHSTKQTATTTSADRAGRGASPAKAKSAAVGRRTATKSFNSGSKGPEKEDKKKHDASRPKSAAKSFGLLNI